MARGGARLNAGAKAKWKHGKTKTIRVPEALVPQILEYSKKLDAESNIEKVTQSKTVPGNPGTRLLVIDNTLNLSNISIHRFKNRSFVFIEDLIRAGYEIQPSKLAAIVLDEMYKSQIKGANRGNGS
jgi:hypothetical protein